MCKCCGGPMSAPTSSEIHFDCWCEYHSDPHDPTGSYFKHVCKWRQE